MNPSPIRFILPKRTFKKVMDITRLNHYVPVWYQKRFLPAGVETFFYLDFYPEKKLLSDGRIATLKDCHHWEPKRCFKAKDLYTTSFFGLPNDEIERYLFGAIDKTGAAAVQALLNNDIAQLHELFKRSMFGLPDEILKRNIKTASPNSSDEQVEGALDYIKRERLEDPLALLQPIAPGEKGGQYLVSNLAPNNSG